MNNIVEEVSVRIAGKRAQAIDSFIFKILHSKYPLLYWIFAKKSMRRIHRPVALIVRLRMEFRPDPRGELMEMFVFGKSCGKLLLYSKVSVV